MSNGQEKSLRDAVIALNLKSIRTLLGQGQKVEYKSQEDGSVVHELLQYTSATEILACKQRRTMMYVLINAGLDVNLQDKKGNTALHLVAAKLKGDPEMAEPLLQGGAIFSITNNEKKTILGIVLSLPNIPAKVTELFKKYSPGLWQAVETDDLLSVRKLLNMWCRVDIEKNDQTLKEKALDIGTEHIIRLIKEIAPSMKLAHAVLAEDFTAAEQILKSQDKVNIELKNLGDMGATPLFYAILQNDTELVRLLCQHGAKVDSIITLEDEEIPILFAALHKDADPEMIKYLIQKKDESHLQLGSLNYRGRHVLFHCIKNDVSVAVIRHILHQGYSELVYLRNEKNQSTRELAVQLRKYDYVTAIDEAVYDWYLDVFDQHRKALALRGYTDLREATKDGVRACEVVQSMETCSPQAQFDTQLQQYQEQIERFVSAVVAGNLDQVKAFINFTSENPDCFISCLVDSRAKGDAQPPLHKALLHGHLDVLEYLVQVITSEGKKIDDVRDQCMRTVLHYAYAMPKSRYVVNLLIDYGASEFTMDKDCRSPLVFKDFSGQPDMEKLLIWHRDQLYSEPEPEPWSKRLPPILVCMKAAGGTRTPIVVKGPAVLEHHNHTKTVQDVPERKPQSYWTTYCAIL